MEFYPDKFAKKKITRVKQVNCSEAPHVHKAYMPLTKGQSRFLPYIFPESDNVYTHICAIKLRHSAFLAFYEWTNELQALHFSILDRLFYLVLDEGL